MKKSESSQSMEQSGEASRGEDGGLQERLGGLERRSNTAKKNIREEKLCRPPLTPSLHWLASALDNEDVNRVDGVRLLRFCVDGVFYLLEDRIAL